MNTYQITTETGRILAENMTEEMIDAWWAENEAEWFGLRLIGQTIVVGKAQ